MSSAKTKAYKDISNRLMEQLGKQDIIIADGEDEITLPRLKWVDKNRGQIQHLTKELGIPMPAILISFPEVEYEYQGGGNQKGMATIRITHLFESYADTFYGSVNQDIALQYLLYNDAVYEALENYFGCSFSALKRIKEEEEEEHEYLIITHIDFLTEFTDSSRERILQMSGEAYTVRETAPPSQPVDDHPADFIIS